MSCFQLSFLFLFVVNTKIIFCLCNDEIVTSLIKDTLELKKQLNSLKETMSLEISELRNENIALKIQISKLEHQETDTRSDKIKDSTAETDLKSKRLLGHPVQQCQCGNKNAFSVSLKNHLMNLGNYQTIKFDNVFLNGNNVYSPMTGVFTAPNNGTYFFTATTMSHHGEYFEAEITLNGKGLVNMFSWDVHHEQGTNSVVISLKAGDMVWIRHHGNEGSNIYGDQWSTFSGFQIY